GLEDADFGHRLEAAGIIGYSLRYTAPVFHLAHDHPYVRADELTANRALYDANRAARVTRTPYGLPPSPKRARRPAGSAAGPRDTRLRTRRYRRRRRPPTAFLTCTGASAILRASESHSSDQVLPPCSGRRARADSGDGPYGPRRRLRRRGT